MVRPSGETAIPQGRRPTATRPTTWFREASTIDTTPALPLATYTHLPSGETTTPTGFPWRRSSGIVVRMFRVLVSTTVSVPPISAVTYARLPSGEKATERGRTSTRKLATTLLA